MDFAAAGPANRTIIETRALAVRQAPANIARQHATMLRVCLPWSIAVALLVAFVAHAGLVPTEVVRGEAFNWLYVAAAMAPGAWLVVSRRFSVEVYGLSASGLLASVAAAGSIAFVVVAVTSIGTQVADVHPLRVPSALDLVSYGLHVLVQEMLTRGLQVSLYPTLGVRRSVVVAALAFAIFHAHFGFALVVLTFGMGLAIGVLYVWMPNLAGAWLLHFVVGVCAMCLAVF